MIQPARGAIELDRQRDTGRNAGSDAEEETETKAVAGAEDNRIRDGASQQSQRTVLTAQQVVSEIEAAQHIETATRNADGREGMVIHFERVRRLTIAGFRGARPYRWLASRASTR
jgi:hypothetical protein